jgi:hypothetical protein
MTKIPPNLIGPAHLFGPFGQPVKACPKMVRWNRIGPAHLTHSLTPLSHETIALSRSWGDSVAAMAAAMLRPSPAAPDLAANTAWMAARRSINPSAWFRRILPPLLDRHLARSGSKSPPAIGGLRRAVDLVVDASVFLGLSWRGCCVGSACAVVPRVLCCSWSSSA